MYPVIYLAKWIVTGSNPRNQLRGMDFYFDVIDWVGGYPYEYASRDEVLTMVEPMGFTCSRVNSEPSTYRLQRVRVSTQKMISRLNIYRKLGDLRVVAEALSTSHGAHDHFSPFPNGFQYASAGPR
jgi:hypothetical protein